MQWAAGVSSNQVEHVCAWPSLSRESPRAGRAASDAAGDRWSLKKRVCVCVCVCVSSFTNRPRVQVASLHTDHMAGDNARRVNYWYRQASALPMERVPGFAFHQSEVRSLAKPRGASYNARPTDGYGSVSPPVFFAAQRLRSPPSRCAVRVGRRRSARSSRPTSRARARKRSAQTSRRRPAARAATGATTDSPGRLVGEGEGLLGCLRR